MNVLVSWELRPPWINDPIPYAEVVGAKTSDLRHQNDRGRRKCIRPLVEGSFLLFENRSIFFSCKTGGRLMRRISFGNKSVSVRVVSKHSRSSSSHTNSIVSIYEIPVRMLIQECSCDRLRWIKHDLLRDR